MRKYWPGKRRFWSTAPVTVTGTVASSFLQDASCPATGAVNVVYVYAGTGATPDDIGGSGTQPVTTANVTTTNGTASYTATATNVTYNATTQTQSAAVLDGFIASDVTGGTVAATGLARKALKRTIKSRAVVRWLRPQSTAVAVSGCPWVARWRRWCRTSSRWTRSRCTRRPRAAHRAGCRWRPSSRPTRGRCSRPPRCAGGARRSPAARSRTSAASNRPNG